MARQPTNLDARDHTFYSSVVDADTENQIEILKKLNSKYRSVRVTLIDPNGDVIYDSDINVNEFRLENHAERKEFREALLGKLGEDIRRSESVGEDSFYFAMRVEGGAMWCVFRNSGRTWLAC